ncbi:hypothetical protein CCACVL1_14956 [Corchorus capsularis]|uniref:Uncharacterized protein n=1 Tax=Corchorus capsularis TaxID=210143 RepID=A0A1R3I4Z5_COCAP|nr:hypothetical protein CCACVL1_14956 [Corchorus capsularis]
MAKPWKGGVDRGCKRGRKREGTISEGDRGRSLAVGVTIGGDYGGRHHEQRGKGKRLDVKEAKKGCRDSNEENENVVNLEVEKDIDREKRAAEEVEKEDALFTKKSRKKTSPIWQDFIEIKDADGLQKCNAFIAK